MLTNLRRFLAAHDNALRIVVLAAIAVLLVLLPTFGSRALLQDLFFVFTMLALAQYWNLLAGYTGLVSVGQQAFVGLGAYSLFALVLFTGLDPLFGIVLGGIVASVLALPTALVVFRLRGAYFAVGTWVAAEVFRLLLAQYKALGGGTGTSLGPEITNHMFGLAWIAETFQVRMPAARDIANYWLALLLLIITLALVYFLLRSRRGLALAAIRDSETAAVSLGVDSFRSRLFMYVLAAFGTGMVGAVIYLQKARVSPDAAFSLLDWTAYVIFIVVIGGIGTLEGPIIGALVLYVLQDYLAHLGTYYLMILGALAAGVMLIAPRGIWGYVSERFGWEILPVRRHLAGIEAAEKEADAEAAGQGASRG
jgi:branched-chain amino acid transport system permease protein